MAEFGNIKHFTESENWGNPRMIKQELVEILDKLRDYLECPIQIHCAYEKKGHKAKGYHPKGMAVDFHFMTKNIDFLSQYRIVELFLEINNLKCGLGVYPHWNNKGFHLDIRGYNARWMRNKNNEYVIINENEL